MSAGDGDSLARDTGWRRMGRALRGGPAIVGCIIVATFVVLALLADVLAPYSTSEPSCGVYAAPTIDHPLGCDDGGIDVLSLVLIGGRISMLAGFSAAAIAVTVGTLVGIIAGYAGGWVDTLLMRVTDYFIVIPQIVLMIVIAAVWGSSLLHVILVIGFLMWTSTARIIRVQVAALRQRAYVRRAESMGAGPWHIVFRHIMPQLGPLLLATSVIAVTVAIFNETALAFLGLSDPTAITWGTIMQHAFQRNAISTGSWWAIVPAGLAVAVLITGCYLMGNALEDALNPRLRSSHLSLRSWRFNPSPLRESGPMVVANERKARK